MKTINHFKIVAKIALLTIFCSLSVKLLAADIGPAYIQSDTTWSGTINITGNIIVSGSKKLTINPATVINFKGYYSITVYGNLKAIGGSGADTIRFTMLPADTAAGFWNPAVTSGGWAGITINTSTSPADSIVFKYCKIEFIKKTGAFPQAISFSQGYKLSFTNCYFKYNTGCIYAPSNDLYVEDCKFYKNYYFANTATMNYEIRGGGANFIIKNNLFTTCSESSFYLEHANYAYIKDNSITFIKNNKNTNYCYYAMYLHYISECNVIKNNLSHVSAKPRNGIWVESSDATITDNTITNIGTTSGDKGIYASASSGIIDNNNISQCRVGIDCSSSNMNLSGNTVSNSIDKGVFLHGISIDTLKNNVFKYNPKNLETNQAQLEINNCAFTNSSMCGIELKNSEVTMYNCLIANNSGTLGSALTMQFSNVNIINSTIAYNADAGSTYAPVYFISTTGDIINTIIWNNKANSVLKQVYISDNGIQPDFYNCDIQGGQAGFILASGVTYSGTYNSACIASDPKFETPTTDVGNSYDALGTGIKWNLLTSSPCINGGITSKNTTLTDYKGNTRTQNGVIDMGAYETHIGNTTFTGGAISGESRWMSDTVLVTGTPVITSTGSLTIDPGVVVVFNDHLSFMCYGTLKAIGTEQAKITFTVANTQYYYSTSTYDGGWLGISFLADASETDTSILRYCNFKYIKDTFKIDNRHKIKIEDCLFDHGNAYNVLHFFHIENSIVELYRNTFSNIRNYSDVIFCEYATAVINNNIFYNDSTTDPLLYFKETDLTFIGNKIINNYTDNSASETMLTMYQSKSKIINNLIANNKSPYLLFNTSGPSCYIANNTISRNDVVSLLNIENSTVENNIIVNNTNQAMSGSSSYPSTIRNNFMGVGTTYSNASCTNCISSNNPSFVAPTTTNGIVAGAPDANWHITKFSQAINNGYSDISQLPTTDLGGDIRVNNDRVDIGAYENQGALPVITLQPTGQSLCAGSNLILEITTADSALYQWQKDGQNISGATSKVLTINNVSSTDQGSYSCKASNGYGTTTSTVISINVKAAAEILSSPESRFVTPGSPVAINVPVTGIKPINYAWYKNGTLNPAITVPSLAIPSFGIGQEGMYKMIATNECGDDTTDEFAVNLYPISTLAGKICVGENITFIVNAGFSATYQWTKDGEAILGETNSTYTVNSITTDDDGSYTCIVAGTYQSIETNPIVVSVKQAPDIVSQPSSALVTNGSEVRLAATATGTTPFVYQWYDDNVLIPGANNSTLIISSFNNSKEGNFKMKVSNFCGTDSTETFGIYIEPNITVKNNDTLFCEGERVVLNEHGNFSAIYQWYKDGVAISGSTNDSLVITAATLHDEGSYYCLVTSAFGIKSTNSKTIAVSEAPSMVLQPTTTWAVAGSTFDAEISATGSKPLYYQWYKNGSILNGEEDARYIITNFSTSDSGRYYCSVENACGIINSNNAYIYLSPQINISNNNGHSTPCEADIVTLSANSGSGASYQWYKDGEAISGETSDSLVFNGIELLDAGNYYCEVTKSGQSKETETRTISIQSPPDIIVQPSSQWAVEGNAYTVEVSSSGSKPFSYQWYKDGSLIGSATDVSYVVTNFASGNEGRYSCQVQNTCGTSTSADAYLYITPKITITNINHSVPCESDTITLDANSGLGATYQWYKDGSIVAGETNNNITFDGVTLNNTGNYYCEVTRSGLTKQTETRTISVQTAPEILSQPTSQWAVSGNAYTIEVSSAGSKPFSYQWSKDGTSIGSATNTSYVITNFASGNEGRYSCQVQNTCGTATSSDAYLYITPKISVTNINHSVPCENDTITLDANSGLGATYQWYKDGAIVSSETYSTITFNGITLGNAGNYYCAVTRSGLTKITETRTISVQSAPEILVQPSSQWAAEGNAYTVEVSSAGSKPFSYQWYKEGFSIGSATNASYVITNFASGNEGHYSCQVQNTCGTTISADAYLYITPKIIITNINHSVPCENDTITLDANSGLGATYQWYKDGAIVSSETNSTITFNGITLDNAGNYYCTVTRSGLTKLTETRTISVQSAPEILVQPSSQWASEGNAYTVEVSSVGSKPFSYQWIKDGASIGSATNASYVITNFASGNEGRYSCQVQNTCGTATSSDAYLFISPKITITNNSGHTVLCETDSITFDAYSGTGASYQWYNEGDELSGKTSATLVFNKLDQQNAGSYFCMVTRNAQSKLTETKTIYVQTLPEILVQPLSQWTTTELTYTVDLSSAGSKPLTYQWYKEGTLQPGKTSNGLTLANFQSSDEGYYYCEVQNACGTATSVNAYTYLSPRLTMTNNNGHNTFCESDSVNLSAFSGAGASYKWYKNGNLIAGETLSSLTFDSITSAAEGSYYCEVSRSGMVKQTETRIITMQTLPEIVMQPLSQWITSGKSYTAEIASMGSKPLIYQWLKNGDSILNGYQARYTITDFQTTDEGIYKCMVDNACGTDTSNEAFMYIIPSIKLINNSGHAVPCNGDTVILSVTAGTGATYQWFKDGNSIANTTSDLSFDSLTINNEGTYFCQVTLNGQSRSTDVKSIFVQSAPELLLSPLSQWVSTGEGYTLDVTSMGSKPLSFQWYKDNSTVPGETSSRYLLSNMNVSNEGIYYCNVSNACGYANSESAFVYLSPAITLTNTGHIVPCEGDTAVLTVTAGTGNTYQWFKDGSIIAETSPVLKLNGLTKDDEGVYYCQASRGGQTKSTSSKTITVQTAPEILLAPLSQWATEGESYTLEVTSLGSKPLNFEWFKNDTAKGTNSSQFVITGFTTNDEGVFRCRINNACGTAETDKAYIYVSPRMTITNLNGITIPCDGDTVEFNAFSGSGATYQWYKDGNVLPGATSPQLTYNGMNKDHEGTYYCKVSRGTFSRATESKIVFIAYAPEIFVQPASQWVTHDGDYTIEVAASGSKPLSYEWLRNDTVIPGEASSRYLISSIKPQDEGMYKCRISNACGAQATVSVFVYISTQITLTNSSQHSALCDKDTVTLDAYSGILAGYQWYKEGSAISGATKYSLVLNGISTSDIGNYYCDITKGLQSKQTETRTIGIQSAPEIIMQPLSQWTDTGSSYSLSVSANGSKPLNFMWLKNNNPIISDNSGRYVFGGFEPGDEGIYTCVVGNSCGTDTSRKAAMYILPQIKILSGNASPVACEGDSFKLSMKNSYPASYQWQKDGQNISGATSSALNVKNVTENSAGNYLCKVNTNYLSVVTASVLLQVRSVPYITDEPSGTLISTNDPLSLDVRAEGQRPISYQWQINGVNINGKNVKGDTSMHLRIDSFNLENEGSYVCRITNMCGSIYSSPAVVNLAPEICLVTVTTNVKDPVGHNTIIWDKHSKVTYKQYNIYRQTSTEGSYLYLGSVPGNDVSQFDDTLVDPARMAYYYKITATDQDNNETDINLCKPHKNIHLMVTQQYGKPNIQLQWDEYIGFDYKTYYIYRSSNDITGFGGLPYDSIASTNLAWTDVNVVPATASSDPVYFYFVSVKKAVSCDSRVNTRRKAGGGLFSQAESNMEDNRLQSSSGISELENQNFKVDVLPNPYNYYTNIHYYLKSSSDVTIELFDLTGSKLTTLVNSIQPAGSYSCQLNSANIDLTMGVYILRCKSGNNIIIKQLVKTK